MSVINSAIDRGRRELAWFLLEQLMRDSNVHFLDRRRRARLVMTAAVRLGDVVILERVSSAFPCQIDEVMVYEAVRGGQLETLRWLHAKLQRNEQIEGTDAPESSDKDLFRIFSPKLLDVAAENGDLVVLQTLLELMNGTCVRLGALKWYRSAPKSAAKAAASHGHDTIVEWLRPRFELPPR